MTQKDHLREIYDSAIRQRFRHRATRDDRLRRRLAVIESDQPPPEDLEVRLRWPTYRALRAAWNRYLAAAERTELLQGDHGRELLGRLRSVEHANFRSALSECLTAWFLGDHLAIPIQPRPVGRAGKTLELLAEFGGASVHVEVKAPCGVGRHPAGYGNLLQASLRAANRQSAPNTTNLLVIVPDLGDFSLLRFRTPVIEAFFGQRVLTMSLDRATGLPLGPPRQDSRPTGQFLKPVSLEGDVRFTRVSAVLSVQEIPRGAAIRHPAIVVHNPYARHRMSEDFLTTTPQFALRGGSMVWTDASA